MLLFISSVGPKSSVPQGWTNGRFPAATEVLRTAAMGSEAAIGCFAAREAREGTTLPLPPRRQPREMPHLPAGAGLALAIEVQHEVGLGVQRPGLVHFVADQILHHAVRVALRIAER